MPNILPPVDLDATSETWPIDRADAIIAINMVHISPWSATEGLMRKGGIMLPPGAPLLVYGPYRRPGRALEPSNQAFDADLKSRNPAWGIRDLDEVTRLAARDGFALDHVVEMPANNLTVVFRRG